eukprot:CAMPEP_0197879758 /NCGR_PEP_ID=MMETSP1439-20131203/7763_1 /TAXON_ID=66791 /ORGANISM="Gonyaulax spinifera, Strain CCMP409" /LENGTH=287 /DNA_ID=CAMNT_0043499285 /DNA_START=135 /DNA_END=998 /DNA_ORIENTATION=-
MEGNNFLVGAHCGCPANDEGSFSALTAQLRKLLAGKVFGVVGDSMARQVFIRMVSILRGGDMVLDHFFHSDATYVHTQSGDCMHISAISYDKSCRETMGESGTGILKFRWDPKDRSLSATHVPGLERLAREGRLDGAAVMTGYWFKDYTKSSGKRVPYVSESVVVASMASAALLLPSVPIFTLTVPSPHKNKDYSVMNAQVRSLATHPNWQVIDFDVLTKLTHGPHPPWNENDHAHFICVVLPPIDYSAGASLGFRGYKMVTAGQERFDCRDTLNLALVRAMAMNMA